MPPALRGLVCLTAALGGPRPSAAPLLIPSTRRPERPSYQEHQGKKRRITSCVRSRDTPLLGLSRGTTRPKNIPCHPRSHRSYHQPNGLAPERYGGYSQNRHMDGRIASSGRKGFTSGTTVTVAVVASIVILHPINTAPRDSATEHKASFSVPAIDTVRCQNSAAPEAIHLRVRRGLTTHGIWHRFHERVTFQPGFGCFGFPTPPGASMSLTRYRGKQAWPCAHCGTIAAPAYPAWPLVSSEGGSTLWSRRHPLDLWFDIGLPYQKQWVTIQSRNPFDLSSDREPLEPAMEIWTEVTVYDTAFPASAM